MVRGVMVHEVGAHYGMERLLGTELYGKLLTEVADRAKAGEADFAQAMRDVPMDTAPDKVNAEALAYLVQNRSDLPLVQRILSQIKTAIYRMLGGRFITLNADDLRTMAVAAIKRVGSEQMMARRADTGFYNRAVGATERPTTPLREGVTEVEVDGVMRSALNSEGRPIHWSEEGVRNFWRWFGDSKAVDKDGKPLVVYHGSPDMRWVKESGVFSTMKERMLRFGATPESKTAALAERGYFFTDAQRVARSYADPRRAFDYQAAEEGVIAVYLSTKNPVEFDAKGLHWREAQAKISKENFIAQAKKDGHDGVILRNVRDNYDSRDTGRDPASNVYVAFDPTQIKSATDNRGSFDQAEANIMYARKPEDQAADSKKPEDIATLSSRQVIEDNPTMEIPADDGRMVPAAQALADADAEIARAQQDSQGYEAAVACALRG